MFSTNILQLTPSDQPRVHFDKKVQTCTFSQFGCKLQTECGIFVPLHYVHFVKYDDTVSFYDAVSDTIRRRGGDRGIFTEEGVDTVAYFGGNHGSRV